MVKTYNIRHHVARRLSAEPSNMVFPKEHTEKRTELVYITTLLYNKRHLIAFQTAQISKFLASGIRKNYDFFF